MRPSPARQAYIEATGHGPLLAAFVLEYKRLQLYALRRSMISVLLKKDLTKFIFPKWQFSNQFNADLRYLSDISNFQTGSVSKELV